MRESGSADSRFVHLRGVQSPTAGGPVADRNYINLNNINLGAGIVDSSHSSA